MSLKRPEPEQVEKFLKTLVWDDGSNFILMLNDIDDFLTFSEHNIELQFLAEQQSIRRRELENDDLARLPKNHLLATAQHRFTVALPMQIRYAALGAITNAIEWAAHFFQQSSRTTLPKKLQQRVAAVSLLKHFDETMSLNKANVLTDYCYLVEVRNAVVHSGGVVRHHIKPKVLKKAVEHLNGFSIANRPLLGECVHIDRGALEPYIRSMSLLLHTIYINGGR